MKSQLNISPQVAIQRNCFMKFEGALSKLFFLFVFMSLDRTFHPSEMISLKGNL